MSIEIELKLRVDSHEAVRAALVEVGAKRIGAVVETNHILDRPDGTMRGQGCGLRVRVANDQTSGDSMATFTFKGPRAPGVIKAREELETVVGDPTQLLKMLGRLGYVSVLEFEKRRESWSLDGCLVELDTPPVLGHFVEIEGSGEDTIRAVQDKLGLGHAEEEARSYVSMLISHCTDRGVSERVLTLSAT